MGYWEGKRESPGLEVWGGVRGEDTEKERGTNQEGSRVIERRIRG